MPALRERVEVFDDLVPLWRMFWQLSRRRRGPALLPLTEIVAAVDGLGISDTEERVDAIEMLLALDNAWLATAQELEKERARG